MNAQTEIKTAKAKTARPEGLALLREPFPANAISKLPKPTKKQTDEVRADFKKGIRCQVCGGWHHPQVVHLDYVGHAALTDRLLECDPAWNWEPVSFGENGTPLMDENGGMWIKLTVCGVTRLGYGHPDGKRGGDAIKEVIGDALRNAAMRFGAALDLWHKGDLHQSDEPDQKEDPEAAHLKAVEYAKRSIAKEKTIESLAALWGSFEKSVQSDPSVLKSKDVRKAELTPRVSDDLDGDKIPY